MCIVLFVFIVENFLVKYRCNVCGRNIEKLEFRLAEFNVQNLDCLFGTDLVAVGVFSKQIAKGRKSDRIGCLLRVVLLLNKTLSEFQFNFSYFPLAERVTKRVTVDYSLSRCLVFFWFLLFFIQ